MLEHEATEGPLFVVKVQLVSALKVAVTTLGVPSALSRTPIKVVEPVLKGEVTLSGPPPGNTSPVKLSVPVTGALL